MDEKDPVIDRIRSALRNAYGERLERIVLYGSRARGDASEESDYDVAVFLTNVASAWQEFDVLAGIELSILHATGQSVHAMPYRADILNDPRSPLMYEIRRDGIVL
jgi:predicted nucleotidyltransferase